MLIFEQNDDNFFLEEIKKIMRDKWRKIEKTTRYGWLTAYGQGCKIQIDNADILSNLSKKVINADNYEIIIKRIQKLSHNFQPNDVPLVAEAVLNELNMIIILR